ncbi:hypothetical protein BC938DRAFT_483536 [Jimgerdemannia flammicorona]|uniref:Crossover junction endonuclease MUS81 n=1 Tax=Jimgerdemannia flammicorona TaxID=994334 RepID=A0A433R0E9_9FUNG|nr:hypothetical protein BC938DRAFT_483536 [Jimgerdemannia flammicorona]
MFVAKSSDGHEFVLDIVIERKTVSDLDSSIIDGRYKEQKYRLHKSLLCILSRDQRWGTRGCDDTANFDHFHVQWSADIDEMIGYLATLYTNFVLQYWLSLIREAMTIDALQILH